MPIFVECHLHHGNKNIWLYELSHSPSWIINIWTHISMLHLAILSNVLCLWCPLVCRNFGKNSPITMKHLHSTQYSKGMRLLKTMIFSFDFWLVSLKTPYIFPDLVFFQLASPLMQMWRVSTAFQYPKCLISSQLLHCSARFQQSILLVQREMCSRFFL